MKNKLDNLAEELSCELRSPDYDSVFSSMLQIDSKARWIAKGYGVPVGQIYKAIDFYPKGFVSEFGSDAEGSDFAYSDVMRDLQVLEKQLVPEQHSKYGGIRLPEFMRNDRAEASFPLPGKEEPIPVGGVKREKVVLKEKMGYVDKLIGWIGRHPYLSALGLIGLFAGGVAYYSSDTVKKTVDKNYEKGSKFVKEKYANAFAPAPAAVVPVVNESAVATPQVSETPQPSYDYYDEDVSVGIKYIEPSIKDNVTKMLETMKKITPNRYDEFFNSSNPYVPGKIVRSTGNYSYVGLMGYQIGIERIVEQRGGSDDLKIRLLGIANLYAEMKGGKRDKTGESKKIFQNLSRPEARYKAEMLQNEAVAEYLLDENINIWTKEQADAYLRRISDELKSGEYDKKYD